jgi:hypothetical protein
MSSIKRAECIVAKLTAKDRRKLRRFIDGCLIAIIKFDETRKPEYFVKMKNSMERFMKTLEQLEKESNSS